MSTENDNNTQEASSSAAHGWRGWFESAAKRVIQSRICDRATDYPYVTPSRHDSTGRPPIIEPKGKQ